MGEQRENHNRGLAVAYEFGKFSVFAVLIREVYVDNSQFFSLDFEAFPVVGVFAPDSVNRRFFRGVPCGGRWVAAP